MSVRPVTRSSGAFPNLIPGASARRTGIAPGLNFLSFVYEKEHYEISLAIGNRRLIPAVKNNPDAIVVAAGISCRQEVEHATRIKPLHPAGALLRAL